MPPPTRVPYHGPNGTHWPNPAEDPPFPWLSRSIETPFPGDWATIPNVIDVACSWSAIKTAIQSVTPAMAEAGVLIRVAPGVLPSFGAGSSAARVIENVGSSTWAKRVTVCPRDGFGTVTTTAGISMIGVKGVAWVGFIVEAIRLRGCINGALIWTLTNATNIDGYNGFFSSAGAITEGFEFVEVVFGLDSFVGNVDRIDIFSTQTGGSVQRIKFDGCYFSPNMMRHQKNPDGTTNNDRGTWPHVDTIQCATASGGWPYPRYIHFRDCCVFGSWGCAFQRMDYHTFENLYIAGRYVTWQRFPVKDTVHPFNESTEGWFTFHFNGKMESLDFIGGAFVGGSWKASGEMVYPLVRTVAGTKLGASNGYPSAPPALASGGGAFVTTAEYSIANPQMPRHPEMSILLEIWKWNGAINTDTTPPVWSFGWPKVEAITATQATARFRINEPGTVFWLVQPTASPAPSRDTVVATGTAVAASAATEVSITVPGLTTGTAYTLYAVARDLIGNTQASAATVAFPASSEAEPPSVSLTAGSTSVLVGASVSFAVSATGTAPFAYQWRKGGVNIIGATSATYAIASAQLSDAGSFDCLVTNSAGSVASAVAVLAVSAPPVVEPGDTSQYPRGWQRMRSANVTSTAWQEPATNYIADEAGNVIVDQYGNYFQA